MKYLYLLITLFILVACGPSEEEAASEPTPPPMNVFEGTYAGNVSGDYIIVSILGDALIVSPDEPPVAGFGFVKLTESFDSCTSCSDRLFSFIVKLIGPS